MRLLVLFLVAVGLLAAYVMQQAGEGKGGGGRPRGGQTVVAVEVALVVRQPIRETAVLTGSLEAQSQFLVASKVGGHLQDILVEAGDRIQSGTLVARLDHDEYLQQVEQARAEVAVARARMEASRILEDYARRELDRIQALAGRKLVADTELDAARGKLESTRAEGAVNAAVLSQREAALRAAEVRLAYTRVEAVWEDQPAERVVGERFVDEGTLLSPGAPIVSVLAVENLRAVVFVIERDYARVRAGQKAELSTDAYPGESFPGTVLRVAPLLKESSRQARVEVEVPNPSGRLRPGMFARVSLELDLHAEATVVPRTALVQRSGKDAVFVIDREAKKAVLVPVELGILTRDLGEVVAPELQGEVVTMGHHLLADGGAVTVVPALEAP